MFDHQGILTHIVDADDADVQPDPVQAAWDMHDLIHGDGAEERLDAAAHLRGAAVRKPQ
jgi:hypothetical protein